MKAILLSLLLFSGYNVQAQVEIPDPFKGANIIQIPVTKSAGKMLQTVAKEFVAQGFGIERIDTTLSYFDTTPRSYGQLTPAVFQYHVVAKERLVEISGSYQVKVGYQTISSPMQWTKSNLTQDKQCFLQAQEVAKAISKEVVYSKR